MSLSIPELKYLLNNWLGNSLQDNVINLSKLAGDASVRKYYRLVTNNESYVVMDSTDDSSCNMFIDITCKLKSASILAPEIIGRLNNNTVLVLTDFGDTLLSQTRDLKKDKYYTQAHKVMADLACMKSSELGIKEFNEDLLKTQLELFSDWYLQAYLGQNTDEFLGLKQQLLGFFEKNLLTLPKIFVHFDFHSRNLMALADKKLGVIDYQDAHHGPIGYDAISLWQDAYQEFTEEQIDSWAVLYTELLHSKGMFTSYSYKDIKKAAYICGLQRHVKNLGIFARLKIKYNKPQYEQYIPRLLRYIKHNASFFPELKQFSTWLLSLKVNEGETC